MELLKYIFFLGIVFIVFSGIWSFFMLIYRLLTGLSERPWFETFLFKILNTYFLVSLCAMVTAEYTAKPGAPRILITLVGISILYAHLAGRLRQTRIMVQMNNFRMENTNINMAWESLLILVAMVYFSFGITHPEILINNANTWFAVSVKDLYNTIIIGWIIAFLGIIMLLVNIMNSIMVTSKAVNWIMEKITGTNRNDHGNKNEQGEYTDYEELP